MGFTDSGLTEDKKLIWAGLKYPQQDLSAVASELNIIRNNIDWATFQGHHDAYDLGGDGSTEDISNFTQFKTYLNEEHGFDSDQQDHFVEKIKTAFSDSDSSGSVYDEYEDYVEGASSYAELESKFGTITTLGGSEQTEDGEPVAGIRVHSKPGVSYDGVPLEAGTTEVFGRRVEFSQQDPPRADDGTITYNNLTVSDTELPRLATVTISADVSNTNLGDRRVTVSLNEDGEVTQEQTVVIDGSSTKTVSFDVTKDGYECHDYSIGGLSAKTVCWVPINLIV